MTISVGTKVYYPGQGPCRVGSIVNHNIDGKVITFYHLVVLVEGGGELFVPVDKVNAIGIRRLLSRSEIPKVFDMLRREFKPAKTWKERLSDNAKLLASGSPFDLAIVVESLAELRKTKALAPREQQTFERARRLLICEISEVTGETIGAAEAQIDRALVKQKVAEY